MGTTLPREMVYDALIDDAAFAALPGLLANAHGARSATLHWAPAAGDIEISAHNGYFQPDHIELLIDHFFDDDLWSNAMLDKRHANQVWVCDDLVSSKTYAAGRLYNEWTRQIGDDTFYAVGAALITTAGTGCIGLHRGKSMGVFSEDQRHALEGDIAEIAHLLRVRAQLMAQDDSARLALDVLDRLAEACITLDPTGLVLHHNAAAQTIIERADVMTVHEGRLILTQREAQRALEVALALATDREGGRGGAFRVARPAGGHYAISYTPLRDVSARLRVLLTMQDPDHVDRSIAERLAAAHGLTPTECIIATAIAAGHAPDHIAQTRHVSIGTVRLQIKSIAWKLGCHRQSEIASTIHRMTALL